MFDAIQDDTLVPFDGTFSVAHTPTQPPRGSANRRTNEKLLKEKIDELRELQRTLYASDDRAILLVFQAMDAAGKDGTIRAVMSGVNPAGCQVFSFKKPSAEELDHDFLWRTAKRLPERGRIGIFNRSYYEEVLVVRVHPEWLGGQRLPDLDPSPAGIERLFAQRYESIRDHEKHLARNGTIILKFWLNVSLDEQKARFMERIEDPAKNWKFSMGDVEERRHWPSYMRAYEDALNATSRPWAPWYAIPADNKPYMRYRVASIIVDTLRSLNLSEPTMSTEQRADLDGARHALEHETFIEAPAAPVVVDEPEPEVAEAPEVVDVEEVVEVVSAEVEVVEAAKPPKKSKKKSKKKKGKKKK